MSNKLQLPSLNPWKNVELEGPLLVDGLITAAGGIAISNPITLPSGSALKSQVATLFVPSIISAGGAICVVSPQLAGRISNIVAVANDATVGDLTFTTSIDGVPVTNGVVTIPTGTAAGISASTIPSAIGDSVLSLTSVVRIVIGGVNVTAGTAHVTLQVTVA